MMVPRISSVNSRVLYPHQVSQFARYFNKSPELLGPEQLRSYQVYLTDERKLAAGSIIIAVSALRFLYKVTLKKHWSLDDIIPAPKIPQTLPVVLIPEEVVHFLECVESGKHRTILTACYAAGLRISESIALTPSAIDSKRMILRVEQGKCKKDRYVMLSPKLLEILRSWWRVERPTHWLFVGERPVEGWTDLGFGDFELRYPRDKQKREVDFLVVRDRKPWFLIEVKLSETSLAPSLAYFQGQTKAAHAFQVVMSLAYQPADCFAIHRPVVVPAKSFLSQLL
jgi:hypothetical protein